MHLVTSPGLAASLARDLSTVGWALVDGPEDAWPELEAVLPSVAAAVGQEVIYERGPSAWVLTVAKPPWVPPKQSTRMIKLVCPADGYAVRTTRKWIEVGLPRCPCGREMVRAT